MSKIGVGNLVNIEKMNAAERVLQNISTFHIHSGRRLIDLKKCTSTLADAGDVCDCLNSNLNANKATISQSDVKKSESKADKADKDEQKQKKTISAQCTPDQQPLNNSELHESASLMNIGNLTQSASISAGNLNSLASITTPNTSSMPLSPFATSSTQTFQQQQRISTIFSALQQINSSNNIQSNQPTTTTPISTSTTAGLDSNQLLLDNNNNRLAEQQQQTEKTDQNQFLHGSIKEHQNKQKITNALENDNLYELDHKQSYKPVQPFTYNHGVSFIPLSGEKFYSNLNALQLMQHGMFLFS